MEATLDQPAGKAVEAMPESPADLMQAIERLFKISQHRYCIVKVGQSVFPNSVSPVQWEAGAQYGPHFISAESKVSADDAVVEWIKAALAKREQSLTPRAPLPELPVESALAREPYDARSPNAEERERAEFDENNVGELHDGGPM